MRHWQPEGECVRIVPARQRARMRGGAAVLLLGAVFAGLAGGIAWQWWNSHPVDSGPASAIEWNAVQKVPVRAPDAEDVAWEKRAEEPLAGPVIASPGGARQSSSGSHR